MCAWKYASARFPHCSRTFSMGCTAYYRFCIGNQQIDNNGRASGDGDHLLLLPFMSDKVVGAGRKKLQ